MSAMRKATSGVAKGMLMAIVAVVALVATLLIAGCGGGGTTKAIASRTSWTQVGATYVGRAQCVSCHMQIDAQYQQTGKGDKVGRHTAAGCTDCHVDGLGQPSGYNYDHPNADLAGIGCESCHGPGSKHIKSISKTDITRTPPAKDTCVKCHGGRPFDALSNPYEVVTANHPDLVNAGPTTTIRGPHYAGAAFMAGRNGFNLTQPMPSPHATLPNGCVDCHKADVDPVTKKVFHGKHADGSTAFSKPNLDTTRAECATCHSGRNEPFVSVGVIEQMKRIGGTSATDPTTFDTNGKGADGMLAKYYETIKVAWAKPEAERTAEEKAKINTYKGAMWNYKAVYSDHSYGVHNPGFTKKVLDDAEAMLELPDAE